VILDLGATDTLQGKRLATFLLRAMFDLID
jgi:hypothetical protein